MFFCYHRDGTACASYYIDEETRNRVWIPHRPVPLSEEYPIRNGQVHQRAREASSALDLLIGLSDGVIPVNIFGRSSDKTEEDVFDLSLLREAIDVSKPVMTGRLARF